MRVLKKHFLFSIVVLGMIPFSSFGQTSLNINITATDAKCNGSQNGTAIVKATGGTAPYTYSWSPSGGTNDTASNLSAGNYKVLVTDNNGVTILDSITISQPPSLTTYIDSIVVKPCFYITTGGSCGCSNTLWAVVSGGTAPYSYSWTPSGETSDTLHGACYVLFTVLVTDTNQCTASASLNVVIPSTKSTPDTSSTTTTAGINTYTSNEFKVYPMPASNQLSIYIPEPTNNTHLEIYDMLGNKVSEQTWSMAVVNTSVDVAMLPEGNYVLRLVDGNGQKTIRFSINR
jgi:hypothetical protein